MSKIECFVPLTVAPAYAEELELEDSAQVRELLEAHWKQLHQRGFNDVAWYCLERGYMGIEPVYHAADLPMGMDALQEYSVSADRHAFTGVVKFTLWSEEEWKDLSYNMHAGWQEGWSCYETVLWQFAPERAMLKKVCTPPVLCPAFEHT